LAGRYRFLCSVVTCGVAVLIVDGLRLGFRTTSGNRRFIVPAPTAPAATTPAAARGAAIGVE
jgi:hypothetical protein